MRAAIATRRGSYWWDVDHAGWVVTLSSPEVQDFKGTVEPTVERTKHVNGGCRGLTSAGLVWQCYLGE